MDINLIRELLADKETRELLRSLLVTDQPAAPKPVYVWCAKMTTVDGVNYYHPVVTHTCITMPTLEELEALENYIMLYSENQFEAYDKYEGMARSIAMMSRKDIKLISIPADVFETLKNNLTELMSKVLDEINRCMDPIDRVSAMTHTDAERTKVALFMSVLSQMDTLWQCVSEEMTISSADEHVYVTEDDEDDEDDDWTDECFEEDDGYPPLF